MDSNPYAPGLGPEITGADGSVVAPAPISANHPPENERPETPTGLCDSPAGPSHIGASSSDISFPAPVVLDLRPTTPPRGIQHDWRNESSQAADKGKGKGKEIENHPAEPTDRCRLISLPPELIDNILSYLSPIDLALLSRTCRLLYTHATADHIWQDIIQDHVPGIRVTSAYPFESFHELFKAHDPYWFLPKHKLWFSDGDLTGRLVLVRYDQRRGCIEGYQLVSVSNRKTFEPWLADSQVMIHAFEPKVKLHLDKPILHLPAERERDSRPSEEVASVGGITFVKLRRASSGDDLGVQADSDASGSASASTSSVPLPDGDQGVTPPRGNHRFQAEIPMPIGAANAYCNLMLARPLGRAEILQRSALPFPYGNLWPPLAIPARHRVLGAGSHATTDPAAVINDNPPTSRQEVSDQVFRIRKGLHMRFAGSAAAREGGRHHMPSSITTSTSSTWSELTRNGPAALLSMILPPTPLGLNIAETISTYSTLDPALYTPTPEKPYRGIWVGDYSGHGCEFLLINQPDDDPGHPFDPETSIQRREGESEEHFLKRKRDETVYRGRLEAIKLTGDPNVPRGEYTFVADDIGEKGFVAVVQHEPFTGTRVVRSKGHIAHTGFLDDQYIESQLLLISHDRLAQYWVGFGHISFFERVDIDRFLVPER